MKPVERISGTALPLGYSDVDTDQIVPSDALKRLERTGFGPEQLDRVKQIHRILYRDGLNRTQALEKLARRRRREPGLEREHAKANGIRRKRANKQPGGQLHGARGRFRKTFLPGWE